MSNSEAMVAKATFYYTADSRVDFRQLIKDMAQAFSIRIEMRQIGLRQEASRLGRDWFLWTRTVLLDLADRLSFGFYFAAARYQQLSLNPLKLAGTVREAQMLFELRIGCLSRRTQNFPQI